MTTSSLALARLSSLPSLCMPSIPQLRLSQVTRQLSTTRMSSSLANMKPLKLYSAPTPNGQKVTVFLEELKAAYPDFKYEYHAVSLKENEQKQDWFLKMNPNGRIPALQDPNRGDFNVYETAAILLYLEKHYDENHKFSWPSSNPKADDYRSEVLQLMFFVHGGVGPMQGQANHFYRYAPEKIQYGIDRYQNETIRLYSVLDKVLEGRDWLVGDGKGQFSLADINAYPWVQWHKWAGVKTLPPNVEKWAKRNLDRAATKKGMYAPDGKHELLDKILDPEFTGEDEETKAHAQQASGWVLQGMKEDAEKNKAGQK